MTKAEMAVLMKGIAPVLREMVIDAVQPIADRLRQLEMREAPAGPPGKDGRDGLGFDDMDACVLDDDRTIELSFRKGDEEKVFTAKWPTVIDRGIWKPGTYDAGDGVTWGGSYWIAQTVTDKKPDAGDGSWRMAVRRGRDGKDAAK